MEDFGDRLTFVGRQRGDIHQRPDLLVGGRGDHRAGIGMRGEDDGAVNALQHPVKARDVVR
jgi:hypothetical protein